MTKARGYLLGYRVVVLDHEEARRLYSTGFYGKPLGISKPKGADFDAPLELDLVEALYLVEKGLLEVYDAGGKIITPEELAKVGRKAIEDFDMLYKVYRELRESGYVVRSGLKFGSDFAVYEKGPGIDHAPYLVEVVGYRERIDPAELVRAGRLSHSVRKKLIIAAVDEKTGKTTYIMLKWTKL